MITLRRIFFEVAEAYCWKLLPFETYKLKKLNKSNQCKRFLYWLKGFCYLLILRQFFVRIDHVKDAWIGNVRGNSIITGFVFCFIVFFLFQTNQPTVLTRRACEVAVGARCRRKPYVHTSYCSDCDQEVHRYCCEDEQVQEVQIYIFLSWKRQ